MSTDPEPGDEAQADDVMSESEAGLLLWLLTGDDGQTVGGVEVSR